MRVVVGPSVLPANRPPVAEKQPHVGTHLQLLEPTKKHEAMAVAIPRNATELGNGGSSPWLALPQPSAGDFVPSTRLKGKAAVRGEPQARGRALGRPSAPQKALPRSSLQANVGSSGGGGGDGLSQPAGVALDQRGEQESELSPAMLVNAHVPMVYWLAHKLRGYGLPYQDLVGEGLVALQAAAAGFQPKRGTEFSTYACAVIEQRMKRAALCYGGPVRVPQAKWNLMQQERAARQGLEGTLGRPATLSEVAEATGASPEQLASLRRLQLGFQPAVGALRRFGGEAGGGMEAPLTLADLVADEQQAEGDSEALALEATVAELLEYLPPQQQLAVQLRYGLADGKEHNLKELAEALQVKTSTASRLLSKALGTLRCLAGAGAPALED